MDPEPRGLTLQQWLGRGGSISDHGPFHIRRNGGPGSAAKTPRIRDKTWLGSHSLTIFTVSDSARSTPVHSGVSRCCNLTRALLVVFLGCLLSTPALAQPLVQVTGASSCPSPEQLSAEINQWSVREAALTGPRWQASLEPASAQAARLRLYAPDGELVLQRAIKSDDCSALAKAFAIILETHFLDLGLVEKRDPAPSVVEPQPQKAKEEPKTPAKIEEPAKPDQGSNLGFRAALGAGAQLAVPEPGVTAAAQALIGIAFMPHWGLQLEVVGALPQIQNGAAANDRVKSQAFLLALTLAHRALLGDTLWIEPRSGIGARIVGLRALDIPAVTELTVRPMWEFGLASGLQLGPNWSPRLDVVGDLILDQEHYVIDPRGVVGQGPRVLLLATLGAEFTAF